jgi:hypothetical protein
MEKMGTPSQWKKTGHGGMCLSSHIEQETENTRILIQTGMLKKQDPISKRAGDVAQAVEHLPSKCEVLSSNLSIAEKTLKKVEKQATA